MQTLADRRLLRDFIADFTRLVTSTTDEEEVLESGKPLLSALLERESWLPESFTRPHPQHYRQYLLHCDPLERFSLVSFVWGPGQATPVHDHTVWGMIGVLRGAECSTRFAPPSPGHAMMELGEDRLGQRAIDVVSPRQGDFHQVRNALDDRVSISIHVYGANIGRVQRNVYDRATGVAKPFISGYANDTIPNPWGEA